MTADYAATIAAPRLGRHEQARQNRLVSAEIELKREEARTRARIAEREAAARIRQDARAAADRRKAAARDDRAKRLARLGEWVSAHVIDLLFVPVIGVPALLSWSAMAAFGALLYPVIGYILPAFSEGAMWAFAAAVTITRNRCPDRPVWHLRTGTAVFAVFGAALNYVHGSSMVRIPGLPPGPVTGGVMAAISVAGVIAHQLITAGPRGRHRGEDEPAPADDVEPDATPDTVPDVEPDATPDTVPDVEPDATPDTVPDVEPDATPDTVPDVEPKRTPARTRRGSSTADRVSALRKKHPDWTAAEIAERVGVTDRTVRRHLSPKPGTDAPQASAA